MKTFNLFSTLRRILSATVAQSQDIQRTITQFLRLFSFKRTTVVMLIFTYLGVGNVWGAVVSGTTYNTNNSSMPDGWSKTNGANTSNSDVILNTSSAKIETDAFCAKSFTSIKIKARTYGGPDASQKTITVYWVDTDNNNTAKSLGTISPSGTTLTDYTISSPSSITANHNGYIRIKCESTTSSKGSGVSEVTIAYNDDGCSGASDYTLR